jgi:hypothetical protein
MKCNITGHTFGVGKKLFDHFTALGWKVQGFSRSNGFDINDKLDEIVELSKDCDLFINNAFVKTHQINLLDKLQGIVPKIIVMGSIAGDYYEQMYPSCRPYGEIKHQLEQKCKKLSSTSTSNIVYIKISMLENSISCDHPILYDDVIAAIVWWIENPRINQIDFELKLTNYTRLKIKENLGIDLNE